MKNLVDLCYWDDLMIDWEDYMIEYNRIDEEIEFTHLESWEKAVFTYWQLKRCNLQLTF